MSMFIIYVGDSSDVIRRIRTNHCSGNVEGSALRRLIAEERGYTLERSKRPGGSMRVRIDIPAPHEGEEEVSSYILSGLWKYVVCGSDEEARDFQWYVIDHLQPVLNRDRKSWKKDNTSRYEELLRALEESETLSCDQLRERRTAPGVYVFLHEQKP
jgi:hypothetical protein